MHNLQLLTTDLRPMAHSESMHFASATFNVHYNYVKSEIKFTKQKTRTKLIYFANRHHFMHFMFWPRLTHSSGQFVCTRTLSHTIKCKQNGFCLRRWATTEILLSIVSTVLRKYGFERRTHSVWTLINTIKWIREWTLTWWEQETILHTKQNIQWTLAAVKHKHMLHRLRQAPYIISILFISETAHTVEVIVGHADANAQTEGKNHKKN